MSRAEASLERLQDLQAALATEGLGDTELAELATLRRELPEWDDDGFALAAAALAQLDLPARPEPLPAALRQRVLAAAPRRRGLAVPRPLWGARLAAATGWLAAAAALAFALLQPRGALGPSPPPEPAPESRRRELLARPGVLQKGWTATADPAAAGAAGDVVWDNARQQGFMRFAGLRPNDPAREQYQLWIFDGTRDERYPVDGGVFDVPAGGDALVPIRAALQVKQPTLFAVTVEKPGGVVVSSRGRIVLVAKAG